MYCPISLTAHYAEERSNKGYGEPGVGFRLQIGRDVIMEGTTASLVMVMRDAKEERREET